MKQMIFILGLALSGAGLYIAYLGFTQIDALDTLMLGVYLGGSFILMTIGLYMSLVVFMKKKTVKQDEKDEEETLEEVLLDLDEDEDEVLDSEILNMSESTTMIEDTMVLNLFEEEKPVAEENTQEQVIEDTIEEEIIDEKNDDIQTEDDLDVEDQYQEEEILEEDDEIQLVEEEAVIDEKAEINDNVIKDETLEELAEELEGKPLESLIDEIEAPVLEDSIEKTLVSDELHITSEQKIFNTEFVEARLIGIEGFGKQRILKKLTEGTELTFKENQKHGLKSCEIFYQNKSLGYLSKVDYNKMVDKLANVYKITISTFVYENNKVATVMLNFMFKQ